MFRNIALLSVVLLLSFSLFGQNIPLEGYVFESGNRGFLNVVKVQLEDKNSGAVIQTDFTNIEGYFEFTIDPAKDYILKFSKEMFLPFEVEMLAGDNAGKEKQFIKAEMKRAPGYQFEITLAPKREEEDIPVDAIRGALIEVYNNTTKEEVMVLKDHPNPDFSVNLIKGNHYTVLVRKDGFLAKRMEAFVDVDGCILCFEGVGSIEPGVADNLTEGNEMGVLLANVEMESIFTGKKMEVKNIYYDYGSATLRESAKEELDNLVILIKDNPEVLLELGSHTDARGLEDKNYLLSNDRANSAVNYLVKEGRVSRAQLSPRGYGESSIKNGCTNGVECSEAKHQENRRTELKIVGLVPNPPTKKSLKKMKDEDGMDDLIKELQNQEQIKVTGDQKLEDIIGEEGKEVKETPNTNEKKEQVEKPQVQKPIKENETPVMESLEQDKMKVDQKVTKVVEEKIEEEMGVQKEVVEEEIKEVVEEMGAEEVVPKPSSPEISKVLEEPIEMPGDQTGTDQAAVDQFIKESTEAIDQEIEMEEAQSNASEGQVNPYAFLNGPKIVIIETYKFLKPDHDIFEKHEQVFQYLNEGTILYMIGNFDDIKDAETHLKTTKMMYQDAYILIFDKGNIISN